MEHRCCLQDCGHTYQDNDCIFIPTPHQQPPLNLWKTLLGVLEIPPDSHVCNCHFNSLTADYCYMKPENNEFDPRLHEDQFESVCRICMGTENLMGFAENEYQSYMTLLHMEKDVDLPKTVCFSCLDDLQKTTFFINKCKLSLEKMLSHKKESLSDGFDSSDVNLVKEESCESEGSEQGFSSKKKCELCGMLFKNLWLHQKMSQNCGGENPLKNEFTCKNCSEIFNNYTDFVKHEKTHQGIRSNLYSNYVKLLN